MPMMFLTRSDFSAKVPRCRWSSWRLSVKSPICHTKAIICERIVAQAAPLIPISSPQINRGSNSVFISTVNIVAYIACLGFPAALSTAFIPKYMCENTLPSRMITIQSRAQGMVCSLAPKKQSIGSRNSSVTILNASPIIRLSVTVLPRIFLAIT